MIMITTTKTTTIETSRFEVSAEIWLEEDQQKYPPVIRIVGTDPHETKMSDKTAADLMKALGQILSGAEIDSLTQDRLRWK